MPPRHSEHNPLRELEFPLASPRLLLRPPRQRDAKPLARAINDPRVELGTLGIPYPYRLTDAERYIRRAGTFRRDGRSLGLLMFQRNDGALVGGVGLDGLDWRHRGGVLGYWITPSSWGKGYATEAAEAVCRLGFRDLGLHRIEAYVFEFNPASVRVLEKLGFVREGTGRRAYRKRGRWVDDLRFGLLRGELRRTTFGKDRPSRSAPER